MQVGLRSRRSRLQCGRQGKLARVESDAGKRDKSSVNYRHATGEHNCGNCRYMLPDGHCRRVKGMVDPTDVCDVWEAKRG